MYWLGKQFLEAKELGQRGPLTRKALAEGSFGVAEEHEGVEATQVVVGDLLRWQWTVADESQRLKVRHILIL